MGQASCRTTSIALDVLRARGVPLDGLVEGLPFDLAVLEDPGASVAWADLCVVWERLEALCGGPDGMIEVGRASSERSAIGSLLRSLAFAVQTRQLYQQGARWHARHFPATRSSCVLQEDGRARIEVEIPEDEAASLPFLRLVQGSLETLPRLIGLPDAIVEATLSPHRGEYLVTPPPEQSLLARLRRTAEVFRSSRSAIDELSEQHERLKKSLDELRRSEERYRRLAEHADDLVAEWDLRGRCLYASPSVERLLGWTQQEFLADPYALLHPDDHERSREGLRRRLEKGGGGSIQFRLRDRSGSWHWFESRSQAVAGPAGVTGVVTVSRDVTERRRLEQQLQQAQKMEAVGQLAGGIAHDFNNLLTVIQGFNEILTEAVAGQEQAHQASLEIAGAADKASRLTSQLLAFSRRQVLRPAVIDLNAVVASMSQMLERVIGEDVQLETGLDPGLDRIFADPGQLEQVILNLAVNARDAMPSGGILRIATRNATVAPGEADDLRGPCVELRIQDTGHGMAPEIQARIFEPFFTTKGQGIGSGLGLSTTYGILRQSGGTISVQSAPEEGSSFRMLFPRTDRPAESAGPAAPARLEPTGEETILLVEDDGSVRNVARRGLERHGYRVLEASTASQALELLQRHEAEIRLLLSDVVMRECSGPELAERLLSRKPDLRLLFMSGYVRPPEHLPLLRADENLILKPFTGDVLAARVRQVLDTAPA